MFFTKIKEELRKVNETLAWHYVDHRRTTEMLPLPHVNN